MNGKTKCIGFKHAWNGLKTVFRLERNFRLHLILGVLAIMTSAILRIALAEWVIVFLVIGFVLAAEMVNSAIEHMMDYLNPSFHPAIKIIKDMSAGAVLIAALTAVIVGLFIFVPKLYHMLY